MELQRLHAIFHEWNRTEPGQARDWPKYGKPNKIPTQKNCITYSCENLAGPHRCTTGLKAKTFDPGVFLDPSKGWATQFCPEFFDSGDLNYLNERGNEPRKAVGTLTWTISYEHVVAHELFHACLLGFSCEEDFLIKVQEDDFGYGWGPVYGPIQSHRYAWKKVGKKHQSTVNHVVRYNNENYAWYFTNAWIAKRWDWQSDSGRYLIYDSDQPAGADYWQDEQQQDDFNPKKEAVISPN